MLIALGTAASALAAVSPEERTGIGSKIQNETVIEKNQAYPLIGPLEVEECLDVFCTITIG
jgi:hypothetical protein